ncbi:MAG: hypothetical protein MJA32_02975 [Proteobacteria bacterium]|nr:hypothetical protein [Pseudomonadota bacterium]
MKHLYYLILVCVLSTSTGYVRAEPLTSEHPFFAAIGRVTYDEGEQAYSYVYPDGRFWVVSGDGRTRAGTWRIGGSGNVCLIVGGVFEGCYEVSKTDNRLGFKEITSISETPIQFSLELLQDAPAFSLASKQMKLLALMSDHVGAIETGRGGLEHVYWHRDGLIHVVQPEGWIKVGSWWFDDAGNVCDNVNGEPDCLTIESLQDKQVVVGWIVDGEKTLVEVSLVPQD